MSKIPFLVKTHKQSSPVETFSEALPLPSDPSEGQAVRAQRTRLGGVDKGQHVSASNHPGEVDYATMP